MPSQKTWAPADGESQWCNRLPELWFAVAGVVVEGSLRGRVEMKGRLPALLATTMVIGLLAFIGPASAQSGEGVRFSSIPELEGHEVWASPSSASPSEVRRSAPQAKSYSSSYTSPGAATLLKQPPFAPTDKELFTPAVYPESSPMVPAAQAPSGEAVMKSQLRVLLMKRFGPGSPKVKQTLAIYDAASTKEIIPEPRLRAALLSLTGTAGESAIQGTLDGTYSRVYFGTTPVPQAVAMVIPVPNSDQQEIVFNERYRYENFRLLASTAAHEALHRDPNISSKEELIASSLDSLIYGQFVSETRSLATSGTELARRHNTALMARINSRDASGDLRLLTSTGNIFPDSAVDVPYFAAGFEPLGEDTPGNEVFRGQLKSVVGSHVAVPANPDFDDATVNLLDRNQNLFSDSEVVRLAKILKLNVYQPSVTNLRPAPGSSTKDRTPPIGAMVRDKETNLAKADMKLFVDGTQKTSFSYNQKTDRLSYTSSTLSNGKHAVRVEATDAQDKMATKSWSFRVVTR